MVKLNKYFNIVGYDFFLFVPAYLHARWRYTCARLFAEVRWTTMAKLLVRALRKQPVDSHYGQRKRWCIWTINVGSGFAFVRNHCEVWGEFFVFVFILFVSWIIECVGTWTRRKWVSINHIIEYSDAVREFWKLVTVAIYKCAADKSVLSIFNTSYFIERIFLFSLQLRRRKIEFDGFFRRRFCRHWLVRKIEWIVGLISYIIYFYHFYATKFPWNFYIWKENCFTKK